MFFALSTYFDNESSPSIYFVYISGMWCFSPSLEKDSHVCSCSSSPSSPVILYDIYCRSGLWVLSCVIFSHGVVGCSGQYCLLLFFFRFWLMLWTISLGWVRVCSLWCCFPRRWLVVSSSCSPWFSRSGFGDLNSMLSFIAWGRLHSLLISFCFPFHLYSLISLQFSSLPASLVALPFAMFTTPGLDNVFLRVCYVSLEGCFWSQAWALVSWSLAYILPPSGCFSSSPAPLGISVWS